MCSYNQISFDPDTYYTMWIIYEIQSKDIKMCHNMEPNGGGGPIGFTGPKTLRGVEFKKAFDSSKKIGRILLIRIVQFAFVF